MGKKLGPGRRLEELVKGSMDYTMSQIRRAFYRQFREVWEDEWNYWIEEIFADYVVVGDYGLSSDEFWQVPYERQGGTYVFAARDQWQQIELAYRPQTVEESRKQKILGSANPRTRKWTERTLQAVRLEEAAAGQPRYISGVGVSADVVNGNGRRYPSAVLRAAVSEAEGHLHESLGQGRLGVTGEAEHPSDKGGRPTFLETIVRWEEIVFDEDEGRVKIRGRILETQNGRDAMAIMEGGVLPAISMRAYGRSRMVDEGGRKIEEVTELTITGFDLLSPGEQSDPNAGITMLERKELPTMDPEEILNLLRESGAMDKITTSLQKELQEAMASEDQARKEKALREALGLGPEDNMVEAMLALATSQPNPAEGELEALRESLGLRDTDDLSAAISAREAQLRELQAAESRRQVAAYIEREIKALKYPPWMEKQLAEAITALAPSSVDDAKRLIVERRKEYDGVLAQLELAARGHHHGVEVLGPVIERERGVPAYARGAFEISEAMVRRDQFAERDLRRPRNVNERFAAEYLERFDTQYRHYLIQETKLLEEAEQASNLNLPYSVSRAVVAEAFPRLVATSVFDVALALNSSERVYYEAYSGETGATETVTDEDAVITALDTWYNLANNHLVPGTVLVEANGTSTAHVEGTDYVIDYLNGRIRGLTGGAITAGATVDVTYSYDAIRKGEMAPIERGKGTLAFTTLEMEADRLATQISTEAVLFSRSQIGWDATARTLSMLVGQIQRKIDRGLLYLALAASLSVAGNSGGTWTSASDPVTELVEKIGTARVKVGNRYYNPTSILCSLTNSDRVANWDGFSAAGQRPDADLNANGYVGRLKGLPVFESTEHSDSYILVVNQEVVAYRILQAMVLKGPYPSYDATSHELVAADQYYAEQFSGADAPVANKASHVVIA